jgi:hypothetical protein
MLLFQASIHGKNFAATGVLSVTFEQALAALERLDRLFIEPDGSFVWAGATTEGEQWQVDGNLIDQGECLAYVELKGKCPEGQFDRLLSALEWPRVALVFQLRQRGTFVDEAEFRRRASTSEGAI